MNSTSSSLLTSCWMVSCLSGVYLLSFYLIGLYDGSMSNLCSITSLGIPDISDIYHAMISRFSWRKVMSASSYLASRPMLIRSFFSRLLGQLGFLCRQHPFSCHPLADRLANDWMMRQYMCLSLLEEVEGCRWTVAWVPVI
jgi:hypothetical protein